MRTFVVCKRGGSAMLALSVVAWLLIGIAAAAIGRMLSSGSIGWFGLASFGVLGAVAGGAIGFEASSAAAGLVGSGIGALFAVGVVGMTDEISAPGPGLAA